MLQKVNPDQIEQLSRQLDRLRQTFEETNTGMYRELNRLIGSVESAYHENNVRSAARAARDRLQKIMSLSMQLDDHMRSKAKALTMAAGQYRQTEKEMLALTRAKKPPVFTLKGLLQSGLNRFAGIAAGDRAGPQTATTAYPSILQLIKESLLMIQEWSLESRLAPVKEDARIAALLASLDTGSAEEQLNARRELEIIAKSFEEIARSQAAYRIYMAYGNRMYMEQAHQEAEKYRKVLADLGVSQEWFNEEVSLAEFQKGSPLDACAYNPLKQDGSPMPKESELRLVIAAGMLNAVYREWARSHYDQIEAAVLKAAEQRRNLQEQLDTYNREVPEEDIRKLQQYLKDMNIYHGEITGKYNEEFLIAVAGYQHIANTVSSVAAVRRDMFGLDGYQFEVDGKITKELLELAYAERGLGIRNNPDLDTRGMSTAFTTVGVGEGIVKQLGEDAKDLIEYAISVQPTSLQFWTETIPGYYDLGKAIAGGEITYDDIKNAVGEGLAQEFVVPFEQINELSDKIFSGQATYEESVTYGRALTKAVMALTLVNGAVKSGAKLSAKTSKKLAELLPRISDSVKVEKGLTPGGVMAPIPGTSVDDIVVPRTPAQENYLKFMEGEGSWRTPKVPNINISKNELGEHLGSGGNKDVYAYGNNEAVGVLKPGKPKVLLDDELKLLDKLDELGFPTVNARSVNVDDNPALMFDRFAQGSKDVVRLQNGKIRIVGESPLLNQQSINDLNTIKRMMIEKKVRINDLQFLIGKDGKIVVADPLDVIVGEKPSANNVRMIDLLIEAAKKNID